MRNKKIELTIGPKRRQMRRLGPFSSCVCRGGVVGPYVDTKARDVSQALLLLLWVFRRALAAPLHRHWVLQWSCRMHKIQKNKKKLTKWPKQRVLHHLGPFRHRCLP